jgi:hypothetical protein
MVIPEYEVPVWGENYAVLNKGGPLPLWSGKGPVPAVGDVVPVGRDFSVKVEGYKVDAGWLMLVGERNDGKRGDLAGAEINWKRMK